MKRILSTVSALFLVLSLGACTTPGAVEIPIESQPAETAAATRPADVATPESAPVAHENAATNGETTTASNGATAKTEESNPGVATSDEPKLPVEELDYQGVNGGKAVYELDGTPEEVLAMLLDFENANDHRAWASKYTNKRVNGDETTVHWHFHGKAGVDPDCDLVFTTMRRKSDIVLRFKQKEGVFGLAAFFGDYRLQPAGPQKTKVTARVFAASGILIADASHEDIADGLREDARLTTEWMKQRLAK